FKNNIVFLSKLSGSRSSVVGSFLYTKKQSQNETISTSHVLNPIDLFKTGKRIKNGFLSMA
ncbi:hypothetical protein, partial [Escherichia coli]|uniref:hypothetical protein n=1 Tax=Escherichia coli TaxID=562 RepID=UPI001BFC7F73